MLPYVQNITQSYNNKRQTLKHEKLPTYENKRCDCYDKYNRQKFLIGREMPIFEYTPLSNDRWINERRCDMNEYN